MSDEIFSFMSHRPLTLISNDWAATPGPSPHEDAFYAGPQNYEGPRGRKPPKFPDDFAGSSQSLDELRAELESLI